jgi:hypothetical protein
MEPPMNAETLYKGFVRHIDLDEFPSIETAGFFGMGGEDLERVSPILGVWQGLNKYGLLKKDEFKLAIREDKIGEFFEQGRLKLAAQGHGYSLQVPEMNVFFDGLPQLEPEPPQDLVRDTSIAYMYAMDTYTTPHFHNLQTRLRAWENAENLIGQLILQPELTGAFAVLKRTLSLYKEARALYHMRRKIPAGLAELVRTLQASQPVVAAAKRKEASSDTDSSEEAW